MRKFMRERQDGRERVALAHRYGSAPAGPGRRRTRSWRIATWRRAVARRQDVSDMFT